jgi:hypothetical protein
VFDDFIITVLPDEHKGSVSFWMLASNEDWNFTILKKHTYLYPRPLNWCQDACFLEASGELGVVQQVLWIRIYTYVFGSPGSISVSQRYESGTGSGSFHHQEKIVRMERKTLIPSVLWLLYDFLSLKNYVNVPSKSNKHKTLCLIIFCWHLEGQGRK